MKNYILHLKETIKALFSTKNKQIIFLDFDGVLCPINDKIDDGKDKFGPLFNAECVKQFNSIIAATDAKIVITSSWRQYLSLWQLRRMWRKRNMSGKIVGRTPQLQTNRGDEIDKWLTNNRVHYYVILDDMDFRQFNEHHKSRLVTCDGRIGLIAEDKEKVIEILNKYK